MQTTKTKKQSAALATKPAAGKTALATNTAINYAADAGKGLEGADKSSYAIPFITVLQGLSPQLEIVDGAKPGLLINTITNELSNGLQVIPCAFQRRYLRWTPRDQGGGYKGELHPADVETNKVPGLTKDADGHFKIGEDELKDTRNHFVLVRNGAGQWQPALLSLSSTQLRKSKRWMSRISSIEMKDANGQLFTPPSFSHIYQVTTVKEENDKGAWWGIEINLAGPVTDADLYAKAKQFSRSVSSGEVETAPPPPPDEAAANKKF